MFKKSLFVILNVFFSTLSWGQHIGLTLQKNISISENSQTISNPWNAGVNAVQFFEIDLTLDGIDELVLFDRPSRKISVYKFMENEWAYAPELIFHFPSNIRFWIHLQDLDGDQKKDLIIGEEGGIFYYKNTSTNSAFSFSKNGHLLETTTFSGATTPLLSSLLDTPAFYDINNDGSLDFFTFIPSVGGSIEYHQHMGLDENGFPSYKKVTNNWGGFHECGDCATYIFDDQNCSSNGKILHLGSAVTIYDINNNGLGDVLIGEMDCSNLVAIPNKGDQNTPFFDESITNFPSNHPVSIPLFPAAFFIDLNKNGTKEMLVSPNLTNNEGNYTDFSKSTWAYSFSTSNNDWTFDKDRLFQALDFGERTKPFAVDLNNNGQKDLLIGYRNSFDDDGTMQGGGIAYLENTGSDENPSFNIIDKNYLGLTEWGKIDLIPFLLDYNNDGQLNLLISGRTENTNEAAVYLFSKVGNQFSIDTPTKLLDHRPEESISIEDINEDGLFDIIVGTFSGELKVYIQNSSNNFVEDTSGYFSMIESDLLRKYPSILIDDLDKNGTKDLLVFDDSGSPRIWRDFNLPTMVYQENNIFSTLKEAFHSINIGMKNYPTRIGDYIIIGSESGGLQLSEIDIYAPPTSVSPPKQDEIDVVIYPNPVTNDIVTIQNNYNGWLNYEVVSLNGNKMLKGRLTSRGKTNLTTINWTKGIYIIQFKNNINYSFSKKIIVK